MTNLPAPAQLSTLNREISALTERLSPVREEAVLRSLEVMQAAGMSIPSGIDPNKLDAVYGYALEGVPNCGLAIATQKLIKGDYAGNPDILLGMIPKPPILAALAKAESRLAREDLARKREIAATLTHQPPEIDRSPEVMARVRARLNQTKAAAGGIVVQKSMSPERAEELARILALPDARSVSAEQMAYRRKIEMDLDAVEPIDEERAA
ncbi:hypothetical protein U8C37_12640 [Sinorhizobium medicae]|uniref:hypothetical protein n=1 Tax=Sinorhizobium medicae TaxID=110321 RepID=UPI002AF6C7FA|nr:hypothetical protein [Sinorhizobium medicae]WQO84475.1 hypothetical protein U8C37_12640 [Sinorhizobium medicae]